MNPYEVMKFHEKEFTKSDQLIYDSILENPQNAISFSIVKSAELMHTSKDALLRFCKKIGYAGFKEFRFELARYVHSGTQSSVPSNDMEKRKQIIEIYKKGLDDLHELIQDDSLSNFVNLILQASNIHIFGIHRTGLIAKELEYRLLKIGIASNSHTDSLFFKAITDTSKEQELHIYFSLSATSHEIMDTVKNSQKGHAKTVLITQNMCIQQTTLFDQIIFLPTLDFLHHEFFLDATMLCYPLIEMLIMQISANMIQ